MITKDRRSFIKSLIIGGIALHMPFVFSCNTEHLNEVKFKIGDKIRTINTPFLQALLNILFPNSDIAPGATELKADLYFLWVLQDSLLPVSEREYLVKGLAKINTFSQETFSDEFTELNHQKREEVVELASKTKWGEKYLSRLMTLIIEAMFANPVYQSNPNTIGWKWVNYQGGFPQPQTHNKYPEILNLRSSIKTNTYE